MTKNRIENTIYEDTLIEEVAVVGKTPDHIEVLKDDISIEFYVGESASGPRTWCTAVVSVKVEELIWKQKYDSGRIFNDLEVFVKECLGNIKLGWEIKTWRRLAREEIEVNLTRQERLKRWLDTSFKGVSSSLRAILRREKE